ncbi:hypothetical protein BZA70DRAFT_279424 [Myxozyma melibiosi]|uniref:Genetic interactor of prohibitins 3, mitochondrial n=1 Tax=Myxozyma melibiosi TaxID=54550 RepID=A0ABR1F5Y1_9ASCO
MDFERKYLLNIQTMRSSMRSQLQTAASGLLLLARKRTLPQTLWRPPLVHTSRSLTGSAMVVKQRCPSCGGKYAQEEFHDKPAAVAVKKASDRAFEKFAAELTPEEMELLGIGRRPELSADTAAAPERICHRCHVLHHHNRADLLPAVDYRQVFGHLPTGRSNYTVVHVIDAYDAPLSILPLESLLRAYGKTPQKILYVFNRVDLFVDSMKLAKQRLRPYFSKILEATIKVQRQIASEPVDADKLKQSKSLWNFGMKGLDSSDGPEIKLIEEMATESSDLEETIDGNDIFLVSARNGRGIDNLTRQLGNEVFFVGYSNVGKSRVIRSIINHCKEKRPQANIPFGGPGDSHWPGMTRNMLEYTVKYGYQHKRLVDLPGLEDSGFKKWRVIDQESVAHLVKGRFLQRGKREHVTVKKGQCLNIGGLVFVESPDVNVIAWNMIGQRAHVNSYVNRDYEKAAEMTKRKDASKKIHILSEAVDHFTLAATAKIDGGGADVLIQGLGYIEFRISGKVPSEGATLNIHTVPGVNVALRRPVFEALKDRRENETESIDAECGSDDEQDGVFVQF